VSIQAGNPIYISSDMFGARERFDEWRESYMLKAVRVDLVTPDRSAFRAATRARMFRQLGVVASTYGPAQALRTKPLLSDGNDDTHLLLVIDGALDIAVGPRAVRIHPGEAALMPIHEVSVINSNTQGSSLRIKLPRAVLPDVFGRGGPPLMRAISAQTPALRLLSIVARGLVTDEATYDAPMSNLAEQQLRELLAHVFAPDADLARAQPARGVQTARLQAIMADVRANLGRGDLSVSALAAHHRLPVRYVQRLFEMEGTTFTDFVLSERLACAHRLLGNPRGAHLKISAIAGESGFGNLSYFNQTFRRRYGVSPSELRAARRRLN
jgi:AraC-like DNA-binding protein